VSKNEPSRRRTDQATSRRATYRKLNDHQAVQKNSQQVADVSISFVTAAFHASRDSAMSKCQSTTSEEADRIARDN
jgi:hypothetical protein